MDDLSKYTDSELMNLAALDFDSELNKRGYEYGWYKPESFIGAIYILTNPAFDNLVKIGYADDVEKRIKTLNSSSGTPDPFHCYAIYKVKKRLGDKKLHGLIDTLNPELRHSKKREFYEMDAEKAYDILSAIAQISGNESQLIKDPFDDPYFKSSSKKQDAGTGKTDGQKQSRLTFAMLGIPVGSELVYKKDDHIRCVTVDDMSNVSYNGVTYTISGLAKKMIGFSVQGGQYFSYNGELLTDIRKRLGV